MPTPVSSTPSRPPDGTDSPYSTLKKPLDPSPSTLSSLSKDPPAQKNSLCAFCTCLYSFLISFISKLFCTEKPLHTPLSTQANDSEFKTQILIKETIDPNQIAPPIIKDSNKQFLYKLLTKGKSLGPPISYSEHSTVYEKIKNMTLFQNPKPNILERQGYFQYPQDTPNEKHWTLNYAHASLFGFCPGSLYAQDEHQVSEHPGLYHVYQAFKQQDDQALAKRRMGHLDERKGEIALLQNVARHGNVDTQKYVPLLGNIYGNNFFQASQETILNCTKVFEKPQTSHIVAMPAACDPDKCYSQSFYNKKDLQDLFHSVYTAFSAVKENSENKTPVIDTGNWGCGAFGNNFKVIALLQIAAARAAGVDLHYYPSDSFQAFREGHQLIDRIAKEHPQMTIDGLLTHLERHAQIYHLKFGMLNGT